MIQTARNCKKIEKITHQMYSMAKRCIAAYIKNYSIKNCNTVQFAKKKTNQPLGKLAQISKMFAKHNLKNCNAR